jgi:PAS domain S-box-containing protein
MKILIVDDIKDNLYMLESLLRGYGYKVESAIDGIKALEKLSREDFDMIISDILMPRMDGFQLCREVKTNKKLKKIAFVFYTATYTESSDEEFALSLGAERFIVKPTEPDDFVEILREVIKGREMETLVASKPSIEDETVYLKEYNERLIRKLEDKMLDLQRVNKSLKKSEEKYKELIDKANDAVIVFERTGYISFVNPKFCEMTGYSIDEAKKLHFNKVIHPDDLDMVTEYFRKRLVKKKVPKNYEIRILTKAGKMIYIDNNTNAIEKEDRILGILAIMRDITERKRAEERLRASELKLREQKLALEQKNIALKEIIEQIEIEKNKIKDDIATNVNELLFPILEKLKIKKATRKYVNLLQHHLKKLTSSFGRKITEKSIRLTSREIEICNMIKGGLTSKEISSLLNISYQTVEKHRKNIRKKLGISTKNANLASFLQQL